MAETRFTPSPWLWWTSNSWRRLKRDDLGDTQNVLEPTVCRDGHPDCRISEADMSLIAAAPDLYAALEEYVRDYGDNEDSDSQIMAAKARAALAKARGER